MFFQISVIGILILSDKISKIEIWQTGKPISDFPTFKLLTPKTKNTIMNRVA